jgi:hypothetical protein
MKRQKGKHLPVMHQGSGKSEEGAGIDFHDPARGVNQAVGTTRSVCMKARQYSKFGIKLPTINRDTIFLAVITVMCSPAFAQLEKASEGLNKIQMWLLSIGGVCVTIAIMWTGFRMAFGGAQWKDCAAWFWGGTLIGGAGAISALFF